MRAALREAFLVTRICGIDNESGRTLLRPERKLWRAALKRKVLSMPDFNIIRTRKGWWLLAQNITAV
jgi:hypothetical protein